MGVLSSYIGEDGQRQSFDRGPTVMLGLTQDRFFVTDGRGVATGAMISLITHGQTVFGHISLQWLTPRNTGVYLSVSKVWEPDKFFFALKISHDAEWMHIPRKVQAQMVEFSGTLGLNWTVNPDEALRAAGAERVQSWAVGEIVSGDPGDFMLGFVNSPLELNDLVD